MWIESGCGEGRLWTHFSLIIPPPEARVSDRRSDTRDERRAAEWTTRRSRVTNEENNGHETRDG